MVKILGPVEALHKISGMEKVAMSRRVMILGPKDRARTLQRFQKVKGH